MKRLILTALALFLGSVAQAIPITFPAGTSLSPGDSGFSFVKVSSAHNIPYYLGTPIVTTSATYTAPTI